MAKLKSLWSVFFVTYLINYLSTVPIESLYSALKVVMRPLDSTQKKVENKS